MKIAHYCGRCKSRDNAGARHCDLCAFNAAVEMHRVWSYELLTERLTERVNPAINKPDEELDLENPGEVIALMKQSRRLALMAESALRARMSKRDNPTHQQPLNARAHR